MIMMMITMIRMTNDNFEIREWLAKRDLEWERIEVSTIMTVQEIKMLKIVWSLK